MSSNANLGATSRPSIYSKSSPAEQQVGPNKKSQRKPVASSVPEYRQNVTPYQSESEDESGEDNDFLSPNRSPILPRRRRERSESPINSRLLVPQSQIPVFKQGPFPRKIKESSIKTPESFGNSRYQLMLLLILLFVALLVVFSFYEKFYIASSSENVEELLQASINDKFLELQAMFPNQKPKYWKKLKVAVRAIFKKPKQPSVVILLATEGAEETTSCLANKLSEEIELLFDGDNSFIHLKGKSLVKKFDAERLKEHLEDMAHSGFKNGSHVFLLENLNVIPGESAMIFHGLCDDGMAPFKNVVYLMTVNANELGKENANDNELEKMDVSTKIWKNEIKTDQRSSLESRISGLKTVVHPETEAMLQSCRNH